MRNKLHKLAALGLTMTLLLGPVGSAETIRLPKSIEVIGAEAFKGDTAIENVVVPEGAREIGARAFKNSSVKKIKLPESLQKIPNDMLDGTSNVTVIAPEGSKAYVWAVANGYDVEAAAALPESDHPYRSNEDHTWSYTHPEKAYALAITFSEDTYVEDDYDFIILTDAEGNETTYTGGMLSGQTVFLKGNSFDLRLTSDGSVEENGFRVESIEAIATEADYENFGGFSTEEGYDGTLIITGYNGAVSELEIPAKIDGVKVSEIGAEAFKNNMNLTSVKIANGIEMIGYQAFRGCSSLKSVTMPDSVEYVESSCFAGCRALTSVRLPAGLEELSSGLFEGCTSLASVEIPDSVRFIYGYAFGNCPSLTSVTIPAGVDYIAEAAFAMDWEGAENGFTKLQKFTVESGNKHYKVVSGMLVETESGTLIAYPRGKTTSSLTIPDSISRIGNYAFSYSPYLKSVTVPGSVKSIGTEAFFYCTSLEKAVLKSGVQEIEDRAFYETWNLTAITIPASVKSMGVNVFSKTELDNGGYGFAVLATVTSGSYAEKWCFENGISTSTGSETITSGKFEFMKLNGKLSLTEYYNYDTTNIEIPSSVGGLPVTAVAAEAFAYHEEIESIVIPKGVTTIGSHAFIECPSLSSVTLPSTLKEIGNASFFNCGSIEQITLPSGLEKIGEDAFYYCESLKTITIPASVTEVGRWAFEQCMSLTKVVWNSTADVTQLVFCNCENLSSVTLAAGVEEIGESAFYGCSSLEKITLPSTLQEIGAYAFENSGLTTVTLPSNIKFMDYGAFSSCAQLKSVYIPSGVELDLEMEFFYGSHEDFTIYGAAGSFAEEYADYHNIPFVAGKIPA